MKITRKIDTIIIKLDENELGDLADSCEFRDRQAIELIRTAIDNVIYEDNELYQMLRILQDLDDNENLGELKERIEKMFNKARGYVHKRTYLTPRKIANVLEKYSYELMNSLLDAREQRNDARELQNKMLASVLKKPTLKLFLEEYAKFEDANGSEYLANKIRAISTEQEVEDIASEMQSLIFDDVQELLKAKR